MADHRPPGRNISVHKSPGSRSVRRNLFGRDPNVSVDDLAKEREELSKRQESSFKEQWNFDLANDKPLNGRFEWIEAIPLTSSSPLLHVPSTTVNDQNLILGETKNASSAATIVLSDNDQTASSSTSSVSSNDCGEAPSPKRHRLFDSEELNGSSHRLKSSKR